MEPTNTPDYSGQAEVKTVVRSNFLVVCDPLCRVTSLSKILAAVLFIALPFVGAYIGYQFGVENKTITIESGSYTSDEFVLSQEQKPLIDEENYNTSESNPQNFANEIDSNYSTTSLRYVDVNQDTSDFWANRNNYTNSTSIPDVTYVDSEAQKISSKPFLRILERTSYGFILTLPCFIESECGDGGLFKYDAVKKELSTMKGSKHYYPMMTGSYRSPDGTKIAVAHMFTLGVIDLVNDEYTEIHKFNYNENKTFSICEMGCSSDLVWSGNNTIFAKVFDYEKCSSDGLCKSTHTYPSGETSPTTIPTSSTTVKYTF